MAICEICGNVDSNLPDEWSGWECPNCVVDRFVTYVSARGDVYSQINWNWIDRLRELRDRLNMIISDSEIAHAVAEDGGR